MAFMKGAIFDLDGTLLDSSSVWEDIDRRFLSERGLEMPDGYVETLSELSFMEAARYTAALFRLTESPEELVAIWKDMAEEAYRHEIPLKPGAASFLRDLSSRGVLIAAATDLSYDTAAAALENNGVLSFFRKIATTGEAGRDKRYPDVYLSASSALGLLPEECEVYEDILCGIRTAAGAGFHTVAVHDAASESDWKAMKAEAGRFITAFPG